MRRMIVTGSEGFIGKALCRELTKRGVEVIGLDRKSGTEATKVCELLKNGGIDCVFHLAAQTSVFNGNLEQIRKDNICLLYTSPSPRDGLLSRMPSSA